jgi:soluble lytic murein transglycosylase
MQFQVILTSITLVAGLMLPHAGVAKNTPPKAATADDALIEMSQAFAKADRKRLAALLPKAQGHVLEPWAAYWELSARLEEASAQEIRGFLTRYAGTYQEDRLRNDWLLLLGKRREWATFMAEYPKYRMNDDASVRCFSLLTDFLSSQADVAARVQELWLSQREPEEGCYSAAQQLLKAERIQAQTVWQRVRLAFEYDRPMVARQAIGLLNQEWVGHINTIYANPSRYLAGKITAFLPHNKELITLALIRLAGSDLQAAVVEVNKLRWQIQLTQEEISWVWGVIGARAARQQAANAMDYFAQGNPAFMHGEHLVWQARAALRTGSWLSVQNAISAMSENQLRDATWIYWRARALLALKAPQAELRARALFQSIASTRGFYEQLALEELGELVKAPAPPEPLSAQEKESAQSNAGLRRALHAIQIGLRNEGVREWNYTIVLHQAGGMSDRELLAAAQLACDQQVWDRCINTSDRTRNLIDPVQRFPMPFKITVEERASRSGLDPAYVYGLIRQESRFITNAKSTVGAAGLMQVMPATARWTARKIGLTQFKPQHINDRDTNITLGTSYLKVVLDTFDGSLPLAAAAYNAGPNRVRSWLAQDGAQALEAAIWTENVPFPETRDYVKKVLSNTTNYAALMTGQPQSLKARLGAIGPAAALVSVNNDEAIP